MFFFFNVFLLFSDGRQKSCWCWSVVLPTIWPDLLPFGTGRTTFLGGVFINCDVERRRRTLSLWTCAWINTFSGAHLLFIFYSFSFRCVCLFPNYKYVCSSSSQLESGGRAARRRTDLQATDVPAARREKESLNLSRGGD